MRLASAIALLAALAFTPRAGAQTAQGLALAWETPVGCPDEDALRRSIVEVRGRDFSATDRALDVRAVVTRDGARWRAALTTRSESAAGERTLDSATCARLTQAVAMVIALAMDAEPETPEASTPTTTTPVTPAPAETRPPETTPAPLVRVPVRPAAASPVVLGMEAGPLFDAMTLGDLSWGLSLGGLARAGLWEFHLDVRALLPTTVEGPRPDTGTDLQIFVATAAACVRTRGRRLHWGGCGGVEAGVTHARTTGFAQPSETATPWVALLLRARAELTFTPSLAVALTPEVAVPLLRTQYVVEGVGAVYEAPAWSFRLAATVVYTRP